MDGQRRLKAARILCIGAGGLGAPATMYLAAAGVGTLGLVDFDTVDASNLHRQVIYGTPDVGRRKLEAAKQRLQTLNPGLEIQGVVLTMHDARTAFSREVAENVREFFGPKVYATMIPRNIKVAEAPSHGKPILLYDYECAGSQAYIRLATEIIERERQYKAA